MSWREWFGLSPTESEFAQKIIAAAARTGNRGWQYDANSRALKHAEQTGVVNCANIFLEYCNSAKPFRKAMIEKYAGLLRSFSLKIPDLWTLASGNIFPAVRSTHMLITVEIDCRGTSDNFPALIKQSLPGDLQVLLMYDHGQQLASLSEDKIAVWGQHQDALFAQALNNLRSLPRPHWVNVDQYVYQLVSDVSYEETFLLLTEVTGLLPFAHHAVFMVPNRGVVIAADEANPDAVKALLNYATDCLAKKPWPLSGKLLKNANGFISVVSPPAELAEIAHTVQVISISSTYDAQKDALEKYYQRVGEDRFVAAFNVMSKKEAADKCRSWCFWGQGIASSLPKTDLLAFAQDAGTNKQNTIMVSWDHAAEICGPYMQRTEDDPERYRVDSFPDEAQWQQLLAHSARFN